MNATWLDRTLFMRRGGDALGEGLYELQTTHGTLRVRDVGKGGLAIVLVCDMPMLIEHHAELIELLRVDFRVLCVELPGLGFSTPSEGFDFSLESQAGAVREVLALRGVEECVLAFGCVGAYLAPLLAREVPEVVRAVVLMQAGAWDDQCRWARRIDFRGRGIVATPYVGQLTVALLRRQIARTWISKALGRSELKGEFVRRSTAGLNAGANWALASLTQSYFGRGEPELPAVQQDSVLVWGSRDRTHASTDPNGALAYLPRGRLVCFERAGHFPELEEPEAFARVVRELCGR